MTLRPVWLAVILIGELVAGGVFLAQRVNRPRPPELRLERLPASTAAAVEGLRRRAAEDRAGAWREYGEAALAHGFLAEAETILRRAVELEPADEPALWAHARSLQRLGRLEEAVEAFHRVRRSVPYTRQLECWIQIGKCQLRAERPAEAEEAFRAAEKLPQGRLELASLLMRTGKRGEALDLVRGLQQGERTEIEVEMLALEGARQAGEPLGEAMAEERAERAEWEVDERREWLDVERVRQRAGLMAQLVEINTLPQTQRGGAVGRFRNLLEANPPEVMEPYLTPGMRFAMQDSDGATALAWEARFAPRLSIPPLALQYAAQACFESKQEADALRLFERGYRLLPLEESATRMAEYAEAEGRKDDSARLRGEARWLAGRDAYNSGDRDKAYSELTEAARGLPEDPRPRFVIGELSLARGDLAAARLAYVRTLELDPRYGRAAERLKALDSANANGRSPR